MRELRIGTGGPARCDFASSRWEAWPHPCFPMRSSTGEHANESVHPERTIRGTVGSGGLSGQGGGLIRLRLRPFPDGQPPRKGKAKAAPKGVGVGSAPLKITRFESRKVHASNMLQTCFKGRTLG